MAKILSFDEGHAGSSKQNPIKTLWDQFLSLDIFTKAIFAATFLFIITTPFIIGGILTLSQHADLGGIQLSSGKPALFAAYGINSVDSPINAKRVGLDYGVAAVSQNSAIGNAYTSAGLKEIPSLASFVYRRGCYLALNNANIKSQLPSDSLCLSGSYLNSNYLFKTDEDFQNAVRAYLENNKDNALISNYILIDDWFFGAKGDGLAKNILKEAKRLINEITPGKLTICPFYGGLLYKKGSNGNGALASDVKYGYKNFSKEACDYVAVYVYGIYSLDQNKKVDANDIDWNMNKEISTIKEYLRSAGWNQDTPILGIPQAFGGKFTGAPYVWPVPNSTTIMQQSKNWCDNGSKGLLFYTWSAGSGTTADNSEDIRNGIKQGITECKKKLGIKSGPIFPTLIPTKVPIQIPVCKAGSGSTIKSCGGHDRYGCTSSNRCEEYTYRCSDNNTCQSKAHRGVAVSNCKIGSICNPKVDNPCKTTIGGKYVFGWFCPQKGNKTLYRCSKGNTLDTKACSKGCKINPGVQDSCAVK